MATPKKYFTLEQRRVARRVKQARYAENYKGQAHGHTMKAEEPEPETMMELAFALAAPRSTTQEFCGDPLHGRSALDRMRAVAS